MRPTAAFPPGYPLLMTPLRVVTDSIEAQKWLNELFVLGGILLIFFTLLRLGLRWDISLVAAAAGLFSPRLWHFSTMMMSEASFFFTSAFVFYALARYLSAEHKDERWWADVKSPWLWVMIVFHDSCRLHRRLSAVYDSQQSAGSERQPILGHHHDEQSLATGCRFAVVCGSG